MAIFSSITIGNSPSVVLVASLSASSRTSYNQEADKVVFNYTITANLTNSSSYLGSGYAITGTFGNIKEYDGIRRTNSITIKSSSASWSGTTKHSVSGTFYKLIAKNQATLDANVSFSSSSTWGGSGGSTSASVSIPAPLWRATYTDGTDINTITYYTNVAPECPFIKDGYNFVKWVERNNPNFVLNPGQSFTLDSNYIFNPVWEEKYVRPTFSTVNAYRQDEDVVVEFSYNEGYNASISSAQIIVKDTPSITWENIGTNKYKTHDLSLDIQYDISVVLSITNEITGEADGTITGATFVSAIGVTIDINADGVGVCFGDECPDIDDLAWIDKGIYIAEDWDIYMAKDNIGSVAMALTTPATLPYCSCRGTGTMSSTTSPNKITLTSAGLIARSSTADFLISDGGLKCVRAGVVMVSGNVYYSTTAAAANIGVYIYKGAAEITSAYYEGVAGGAVSCAPIIIPVEAGEILYLYERASTSCTIHKENVATHLDVIYLA